MKAAKPWYRSTTILAAVALLIWAVLEQLLLLAHTGELSWEAAGKAAAGAVVAWGRSGKAIQVIRWVWHPDDEDAG